MPAVSLGFPRFLERRISGKNGEGSARMLTSPGKRGSSTLGHVAAFAVPLHSRLERQATTAWAPACWGDATWTVFIARSGLVKLQACNTCIQAYVCIYIYCVLYL